MPQVTIIGAGFAGMALSLFLKKRDISCAIYEITDDTWHPEGTVAFSPNATRVLDHCGVYESIRPRGYTFDTISVVNGNSSTLATLYNGSQKIFNYNSFRAYRTYIREGFREELKKQGIEIQYNKKCTNITNIDGGLVQVEFEDGEKVTSNYVVGTDGINSKVREFVAAPGQAHKLTYDGTSGIAGNIDLKDLKDVKQDFELPSFVLSEHGVVGLAAADPEGQDTQCWISFEMPERDAAGWEALNNNHDEMQQMVDNAFPKDKQPEFVAKLLERMPKESLRVFPFYHVKNLDNWYDSSRKIILIGDSAHAIPPHGGQGAAMALEDAETLSYAFDAIFSSENQTMDPEAVVEKWEQHRRGRVGKITGFTNKNGELRRSAGGTWGAFSQTYREWALWAAFRRMTPDAANWIFGYEAESFRATLA